MTTWADIDALRAQAKGPHRGPIGELRRACRVTLAQWAFIARHTRHIWNDNERHAARTEAMIILRVGGRWVPK
jgi:hypothetical protein